MTKKRKSKEEIYNLAQEIAAILDDKNALDIEVIEISEKSTLADYFVLASGRSGVQVRALAAEVEEKIEKKHHISPRYTEGFDSRRWLLLDYIDVVVHIFLKEEREYYSLDRLWQSSAEHAEPEAAAENSEETAAEG